MKTVRRLFYRDIVSSVLFVALAWALRNNTLGCGVLALATIVAVVAVPAVIIYQQWLAAENLAARPLRAQAT